MGNENVDADLLMLLADLGSPEALAECIVKNFKGWKIPAPLIEIATAVGISDVVAKKDTTFEGILVTDRGKTIGSIAYNGSSRPQRQRFTIAHEIGHFLIPTHGPSAQCVKADLSAVNAKGGKGSKEAEANRFASNLLMPAMSFKKDMRRLGAPETEHVVRLATNYNVSKEAAARRYTDLTDHVCAIVISRNGAILKIYRSEGFPYLDYKAGAPLPRGSITSKASGAEGALSDWVELPVDVWADASSRRRDQILCEQVLFQAEGFRLTMLTIDDASE